LLENEWNPGDGANTHHDEHGHHGADRGEEGDGARLGAAALCGAGPPAGPRGDPTRGEHDGRPLVAGPLGGGHFRAGGLAGPTNAPGARGTSRSRRRKRDAKLPATVSPARGGGMTRAGVLAPSRVAGVPAFEPSRRLAPAQKKIPLRKTNPYGQIVSRRNMGVMGWREDVLGARRARRRIFNFEQCTASHSVEDDDGGSRARAILYLFARNLRSYQRFRRHPRAVSPPHARPSPCLRSRHLEYTR
jgi:hypothetical protein